MCLQIHSRTVRGDRYQAHAVSILDQLYQSVHINKQGVSGRSDQPLAFQGVHYRLVCIENNRCVQDDFTSQRRTVEIFVVFFRNAAGWEEGNRFLSYRQSSYRANRLLNNRR